jgi:hypothetical protein
MKHSLSPVSIELTFLIRCCKAIQTKEDHTFLQDTLTANTLQHKQLINLAYQHAVLPLLYRRLKDFVPTHPLVDILKPYYTHNTQKNIAMGLELLDISTLLESQGMEVLSFKGLALSCMMYEDMSLRQFGDLDLLIRTKDREKMLILLKKHDYTPEITLKNQTKKTFFDAVNVLGFYAPSKTLIEIHWKLLSKNYAISWNEDRLWQSPQTVTIHHKNIKTLDTTTTLLYLCVHGSKHLFSRLSWLCDIDRTLHKNDIVWKDVLIEAKVLGISRMLLLSLSLCYMLLDTALPKEIHTLIKKDVIVSSIVTDVIKQHFTSPEKQPKSLHTFTLLLSMREGIKAKTHFTYLALFAPKFDDFKQIQLPKYLAFLYPFVRVFRLGSKYLK